MDFAIAKISTKGQVVIPRFLREGVNTGDEFLMIKDQGRFILKNMKDIGQELKDDIYFAKRIDQAWKEHREGKFISKSKDDFLKELRSC
jgi:bifunctional DNA-binding transcriptional regulator/antitoxin component of YhaV-PrlF toxin-antitoxin module